MEIEFAETDNKSVIIRRVLQKGRGSVKIRERFVSGKGYRVKV